MYTTGEYLQNNPTWHSEDSPWKADRIFDILETNGVHPARVVEIGCGAGEVLLHLSQKGSNAAEYVGYDISPQAFSLSQQKATGAVRFELGDFLQTKERFDVALVIDVLEHLEDYFSFLRKLKPRADYKVFHIPLDLSVQTVLREHPLVEGRESVGHIHYFTKGIALEALKETGYEVLDAQYTCGAIELPRTHWKTRLAKPLRRWMFHLAPDFAARTLSGFSLMVLAR